MARIEQLSSPRIVAGQPGDIYLYPYSDGALLTGTPTSLAIDIVDEAGTAIVTAGTPTWDGTNKRLTFALTTVQNPRPRVLRATWQFTTGGNAYAMEAVHEAVGELLFSEAEARAYDKAALASTTTYPADTLLRTRDQVHDAFEDIVGAGLGARGVREVADGSGKTTMMLERTAVQRVRSVSTRSGATWTAFSSDELADIVVDPWGPIERETRGAFPSGRRNVAVEYEHGLSPIPLDLRQAGLRLTRNLLVSSNLSDRALAETNQLGTFRIAVAGLREGAWFGIPPVDSVLQFYRDRYRVPTMR